MKKIIIMFIILLLISLGISQTRRAVSNQYWIENLQKEYDERTYLTEQGSGDSIIEARDRAIQNLTERIIIDVKTIRVTTDNITERSETQSGSRTDIVIKAHTYEEETSISTNVKLIGTEIQVSPIQNDGKYYALVYMNRRQSADRYRDMINNNIASINSLIQDARRNMGQLLAIKRFSEAINLAYETEILYLVYGILEPSMSIPAPEYEYYKNATEIRIASDEIRRNSTIIINVKGDVNNRINAALTAVINNMGFNVVTTRNSLYLLETEMILQKAESNNNYYFFRYIFNYTLRDNYGQIIFADSDSGREGATSELNARDVTIRTALKDIADTGFSEKFKSFIDPY